MVLPAALWMAAAATDGEQIRALLRALSDALADGNAVRFLAQVDGESWPGYAALRGNVVALVAQNEVGSSVDLIESTRSGEAFEVRLDWLLQLRPASGDGPTETRRTDLRARLERRGQRWKLVEIEPVSFFRPRGGGGR